MYLTEKLKIFVGNLLFQKTIVSLNWTMRAQSCYGKRILVKKVSLSAWFPVVSENT